MRVEDVGALGEAAAEAPRRSARRAGELRSRASSTGSQPTRYHPRRDGRRPICADSMRSPEMRHEVPLAGARPVPLRRERRRRVAVVCALEASGSSEADPAIEMHSPEAFGIGRAARAGHVARRGRARDRVRACHELGIADAAVPADVPARARRPPARERDRVAVDRELFDGAPPRKSEAEIEGIRRAQRGCEAALDVARELLRAPSARTACSSSTASRSPSSGSRSRSSACSASTASSADEFIVSHGAQTRSGTRWATARCGRTSRSSSTSSRATARPAVYSDMTRTYVVGDADGRAARVPPPLQAGARGAIAAIRAGRQRAAT